MVALSFLALASFLVPTLAAPQFKPIVVPHVDPTKILCQLPFVKKFFCPLQGNSNLTRSTVLGTASGVTDKDGAYRFAVKYATATRWQPSTMVSTWTLPNGSTNASSLPLACPQPGVDSSNYSEDCLSMVLYVPPALSLNSAAPTLVWIHGGSFIVGSATGAGLDGSKLAIATNSIVAVIQYRLGALGFMAPSGQTNLAVKDVVTAMNFLKRVVPAFGGSASKITLSGQSAGASMVRALLAVPSASSLFQSGILQSDTMNFGLLSTGTQNTLSSYFTSKVGCGATDVACQKGLSLSTILSAQDDLCSSASTLDPAAGQNEPIRPVLDGSFITAPLDSTGAFPPQNKPLLITSVAHEAGYAIYSSFRDPLPEEYLPQVCTATFGSDRTNIVLNQPLYAPPTDVNGDPDARVQLQTIGTDYLWRCSSWTFARSWVENGGSAYVGQYTLGAQYPGNEAVPYCSQAGIVCHQDDIQIVFGTTASPTSAQSALTTQMQARYKAFLATGNPNTVGVSAWPAATISNVHSLILGGSGETPVGACDPSFWGSSAQYDYQFYDE